MDPCANVDRIWRRLGRFGRYQVVQLLITLVTIWSAAFSLMSSVFTGKSPYSTYSLTLSILRELTVTCRDILPQVPTHTHMRFIQEIF